MPNSFIRGLVTGAFFGVAIAIVFAPESGRETRLRLKDAAYTARGSVSEKVRSKKQKLRDVIRPAI